MKKQGSRLLTIGLLAFILCGCDTESLPVPTYPLDLIAVEQALADWSLDCTIKADPAITRDGIEESVFRVISAEKKELVCIITSGFRNGERFLSITFPDYTAPNALMPEAYRETLAFASNLMGGFKQPDQLYEHFSKEYDKTNSGRVRSSFYGGGSGRSLGTIARWGRLIDKIACQIILTQPSVEDPYENMKALILTSDWEEFYPDRTL